MNTYVFGDIHGADKALSDLIDAMPLKAHDHLIFLGDYVDGWSGSYLTIEYLLKLKDLYKCTFIRGNHDELFLDYLKTNQYNNMWLMHGGQSTLDAYENISDVNKSKHIDFLENLTNYYLDEKNRLFLHAGFTNQKGVKYEHFSKLFYWDRTLWELALATDAKLDENDLYYPERLKIYPEVYIGHTPTTRINSTMPVIKHRIINMDTGAAFKGPLSAMNVDTKELYQSKSVYLLYPAENGRN